MKMWKKNRITVNKPVKFTGYGDIWAALAQEAKSRHKYCAKCGAKPSFANPTHAHHIIPLAKGGQNCLANLQVLCRECHNKIHKRKF